LWQLKSKKNKNKKQKFKWRQQPPSLTRSRDANYSATACTPHSIALQRRNVALQRRNVTSCSNATTLQAAAVL